ncbi:MAG: methyl-accepting chemotaxis protein [Enterobacterales bacterium]|nr:methyl-accepting chemotaxis protein [Enterobacterales bacterium]
MNLNLKNKFKLASLLLAMAIIAIILINQRTLTKVQRFDKVQIELLTLKKDMLTLRRNEKDFIARNDLKYREKFSKNSALLKQHLTQLKISVAKVELASDALTTIDTALDNYFLSFNNLVANQKELGLTHKLGLYGSLRNTAHVTENEIRKHNNQQLLADLLQLRRNEKDFMLRQDTKYLDKFNKNLKLFKQHLKSSDLSDQLKQGFGNIIDFYQQDFHNFVEKSKEKGLDSSSGLRGEMRKQIHSVENTLDSLYVSLNSNVEQELGNIERFILITEIFGAAIGGLVVLIMMWLSRSILSPIKAIGSTIKNITKQNDLSVRVDTQGEDEIAEIGQSFNHMLESIAQILFNVTHASNKVNQKTIEMSQLAENNSRDLQNQQNQTEQMATAMSQMSSTIQDVASNAVQAAQNAQNANSQSIEGKKIVDLTSETINAIAEYIKTASQSIENVAKDSERIGSVLEEIRGYRRPNQSIGSQCSD